MVLQDVVKNELHRILRGYNDVVYPSLHPVVMYYLKHSIWSQ